MIYELPYRRMLILTEGHLGVFSSKTAISVLRYRPNDCVAVIDSEYAGAKIRELAADLPDVPVLPDVAAAGSLRPDAILVGIAPTGGDLPEAMHRHLTDALGAGLSVISGLHTMLNEDPILAGLARKHGGRIHDIRDTGPIIRIARGLARGTRARRVLTVGTDCNLGKMVTALELRKAASTAGLDAAFVATGQTGIMIEGWGLAIDHVISDFVAGAVEMLVERAAGHDVMFIEGQGSLEHPGYSGVTCSLLHGSCPDAMILSHRPGRVLHNSWPDCPIPPLRTHIELYERMLAPLHPGRVVAIALNTAGMEPAAAEQAIAQAAAETGLPAADVIRNGPGVLLDAVRRHVGI